MYFRFCKVEQNYQAKCREIGEVLRFVGGTSSREIDLGREMDLWWQMKVGNGVGIPTSIGFCWEFRALIIE